VIGSPLRRAYGSIVVAANLPGQRKVPFLAREEIERRRDRAVRATVAYAARTVPYYRELFESERIDPGEIRSAADLERLPMLDRELVRKRPELFLSDARRASGALTFSTNGTTGTPMRVHHDRRSLLANIGYGERERAPVIEGTGGSFRPTEIYVGNETSTMKDMIAFYERSTYMPVRPRRRFVSVREPIERIAALTRAERPDLLVGYGGWIQLFFSTVAARGLEIHPPKMVMYMAEALPHGGRELIEGKFGIPVMSRYSAAEAFKIAFYCERRTGFHLHEDLCHVRIVDADGATARPGEVGRIVLSNLVNRATVLLNYPVGDLGAVTAEPCPCGRSFRLLSELEGRVEDLLRMPDGRFVHPRTVWQVFQGDPDVLQYQLIQHEPDRFALRLATVDVPAYERAEARARPMLHSLLGTEARIEARRVDESEPRGAGKFRAVSSLVRA
jgi:phenylacetate-CoA ligase